MSAAPLVRVLVEIEQHVSDDGWDQPPRLYALAPTDELLDREPAIAAQLDAVDAGEFTPIEQELPDQTLDDVLATIAWPSTVVGCALVVERIVLPPGVEDAMPTTPGDAARWAATHPDRSEVRIVVGVLRDGDRSSVLRVRGHDDEGDLLRDPELAPQLIDALAATLAD